MQQEYIHLVTRLKQQPRLGMPDDILKETQKSLQALFETYKLGAEDVAREDAFGYLADKAQTAYKQINVLEERNRSLAESFNVNTGRAATLGFEFDKLGQKLGVNSDKLKQYAGELKSLLPGQASYLASSKDFGNQILKQTEMLRNKFGLSADAAEGFIKAQTLMGGASAENFSKIVDEATDFGESLRGEYEGATTDILETLGTVDSATVAVFGSTPDKRKGLFAAAIQAKKLGIELSKVKDIADASLDVEQAIASELELQILGADTLNMAALQKARYEGNALAITEELTRFVEANGEQFAKNPQLLKAGAQALGLQESELFDMYAQLKVGEELQKEAAAGKTARAEELNAQLAKENELRIAAGKKAMTITEEATFLADKRAEEAKRRDEAAAAKTDDLLSGFTDAKSFAEKVQETARLGMEMQTAALKNAGTLASTLKDSDIYKTLFAGGGVLGIFKDFADMIKSGKITYTAGAAGGGGAPIKDDLFIPAGGGNTVVSGPFGAFTLNERDDVLAAPGIRDAVAAGGGGSNGTAIAAAIVSALQGMSFHVNNVFDGDKIQSSLQIRRGQSMNNLGNIA